MKQDAQKRAAGLVEIGLGLDDIIHRGARQVIQQAIEAEFVQLLERYDNVKTLHGTRAVVRNGYFPERDILTAVGPLTVNVPKERVAIGDGYRESKASWQELLLDLKRRGLQHRPLLAVRAFNDFVATHGTKYAKAAEKLLKGKDGLYLCTTRTRSCVSRSMFLGLAFKLMEEAEKSWRCINSAGRIEQLLKDIAFIDGIAVNDNPPDQQNLAA